MQVGNGICLELQDKHARDRPTSRTRAARATLFSRSLSLALSISFFLSAVAAPRNKACALQVAASDAAPRRKTEIGREEETLRQKKKKERNNNKNNGTSRFLPWETASASLHCCSPTSRHSSPKERRLGLHLLLPVSFSWLSDCGRGAAKAAASVCVSVQSASHSNPSGPRSAPRERRAPDAETQPPPPFLTFALPTWSGAVGGRGAARFLSFPRAFLFPLVYGIVFFFSSFFDNSAEFYFAEASMPCALRRYGALPRALLPFYRAI